MTIFEYLLEIAYGPQLDWLGDAIGSWLNSNFSRLETDNLEIDVDYRNRLLEIVRKIK